MISSLPALLRLLSAASVALAASVLLFLGTAEASPQVKTEDGKTPYINKRHSKEFVAVKNTSLKANRNIQRDFCSTKVNNSQLLLFLVRTSCSPAYNFDYFFNPAPVPPDQGFNLPAGADELLSEPLNTDFSCEGRRYGYFADVNNNCQVSVN